MADNLLDYEHKLLQIINEWENSPPSYLSKAVGILSSPLSLVVQQVIPEENFRKGLEFAFSILELSRDNSDLVIEAEKLGYKVSKIGELKSIPIYISDCLCGYASKWIKGIASAEGAVTGIMGLVGLAADIPAIILLALKAINKIGACYGYEVTSTSEEENLFALYCLSASASNSIEEKKEAIHSAMKVAKNIDRKIDECKNNSLNQESLDVEILSKETINAAIRNVAKKLCTNILQRKATQLMPLIGGGIGAAINLLFINDVVTTSQRLYQKRRLNCKIIEISRSLVSIKN